VTSKDGVQCDACPPQYSAREVQRALEIGRQIFEAGRSSEQLFKLVGVNADGWVSLENYDDVVQNNAHTKDLFMNDVDTEEDRRHIEEDWPFGRDAEEAEDKFD